VMGKIAQEFGEISDGQLMFPTPESLTDLRPENLPMPQARARAIANAARAVCEGEVDLAEQDPAELMAQLTRIRGIGPWTAQMFIMFNLGRPDVMPSADLGVQKGVQAIYRMRKLPSPEQVVQRTRHLAPYRSAASWYFWRAADTVLMT